MRALPMLSTAAIALAQVLCASSCKTVSREPVAFVTETYHAHDNEQYQFGGWVRGESCEEWYETLMYGFPMQYRTGDREVPRTIQKALSAAMASKPDTVFLANVSIETEVRQECLAPLRVCTVVSGASMQSAEMRGRRRQSIDGKRPDAPPAPEPGPASPSPTHKPDIVDDEDRPSRLIIPN